MSLDCTASARYNSRFLILKADPTHVQVNNLLQRKGQIYFIVKAEQATENQAISTTGGIIYNNRRDDGLGQRKWEICRGLYTWLVVPFWATTVHTSRRNSVKDERLPTELVDLETRGYSRPYGFGELPIATTIYFVCK